MRKQIKILIQEFPQPAEGKVVITLNIKSNRLHYLASREKGCRYFSTDKAATEKAPKPHDSEDIEELLDGIAEQEFEEDASNIVASLADEDVKKNVRAAYKIAGIKVPKQFVSMAARIRGFPKNNSVLSPYGDVVLVVDHQSVIKRLTVFSGDVKTLGDALNKGSNGEHWRGESPRVLAGELRAYSERQAVTGGYFEARLTRSLKATDVLEIYLPEHNEEMLKGATAIKALKQRRLRTVRKRKVKK
jgi:hypothetical protein